MDRDFAQLLEECLREGTPARWEVFIQTAQPVIASAVLKALSRGSSTSRELVDDFIQDCFLRLCANNFKVLRNFRSGDANALRVYLRTVATSITVDHFRRKEPAKSVDLEDVAAVLSSPDPAADEFERKMLLEQVEKCLGSEDPRSCRIFWLYHRQGLTPRAISAMPGIELGVSGVETAVYRLTQAVRTCLRKAGVLETVAFREGGRA